MPYVSVYFHSQRKKFQTRKIKNVLKADPSNNTLKLVRKRKLGFLLDAILGKPEYVHTPDKIPITKLSK